MANLNIKSTWDSKKGITLKVQGAKKLLTISLKSHSKSTNGFRFKLGKTHKDSVRFSRIYKYPKNLPVRKGALDIVLKIRPAIWSIYLNNQRVVDFPELFSDAYAISLLSSTAKLVSSVQKIEAESFVANFMVEKGSTNPLGLLKPLHGIWKIHSANDNALEKFKSKLVATHSPNFYSLKGSSKDGKPGIILTGNSFDSDYSMEAAVELGAGKTGIIFYYQGMRDYYRLTIEADKDETGILKLTRLSNTKTPRVALLAEERIKYRAKQWVMLKAEIKDDEIHCYVDQIERFSVAEALPVGGKYGVYVDNKELIRFDDIRKIELIDRDIRTVSNIRFYSFASQGEFYKKSGFLSFFSGSKIKDSDTVFKPVYQDDERWLILSSENTPHKRFSASFQTKQKHFTIGLICNYSAAKNTFDLLEYKETKGFSHYSVKQYSKGAFKTISNYKRRTMSRAYQNKLLIDKSDKSHIKFYRNGELMIHYSNPGATGAYGIYLGKNNSSSISKIRLSGEEKIHKNKFEKNNIYVGDPFMKHWSSPEGEWITNLKTKETWHKSDFFGRYAIHMPLVDKSRIHLSVEEGKNEGISFKISGAKLLLIDSAVKDRVLKSVTLNKSLKIAVAGFNFKNAAEAKKSLQIISVYYEDYWLWVKVKGQVIFAYRLLHPLKGRRIRIEGFTKQHLSNSFTDRYNVLDFLFNESPHNWEKNGGQWRVINRFQCRPSWSHFNGENDTGLAALWSKYKIKGDFCIEMYAGTRHGKWYNRVGDLNITLMNKTNNASSGYTFTCGGWDFNESQLWTSFYKDGKLIARSDAYTIPRFKNANKRQFLNPLTPTGRDVHGAWYYIKIRKIGKKIEYYFDNTLIFEHEDDEVIDEGSFGVWTYLNSMMIARLRVSADHISLKEVTLSEEIQPEESLEELESLAATLTVNEQPLNLLDKQYWSVNDPISQSRLSFQAEDNEPVIIVENKLGAGTMALESSLLPLPLATISGFRFLIKRSKTANLNFHYQLGKMETAKFIPYPESYFIHISGSDFSRSKFKKIASVDVPGLDRSEVFGDGEWTEVIVHIPANRKYPQDSSYIKLTGFGNFQRSYVQQGIKGNAPGDVYAIKSLQYIYYQTPVLELEKSTENKAYHNYLLVDAQSSKTLIDTKSVKQLISRMVKIRRNGLVRTTLQVISNDTEFDASIYWVNKSPDVEMTLNWSNDYLDCLELTNPNWQDFALASVKLVYLQDSGKELPLAIYKIEAGKIIYRLPPQITPKKNQLRFKTIVPDAHIYDIDAKNWTLSIDREKNAAPSLISLDGLIPYFLNFENIHTVRIGLNYPTIHLDDLEQNAYLEIANKTKAQRLSFSVKGPVNIAKYPLLQFKYRGTRSAEISGMLGHLKFQINEKMAKGGNDIRISEKAVFDYDLMNSKKKWRSWTGLLSKTASTNTWISESLSVPKSLAIRSFASRNQTGIYTWWHLDDLLFGPATNKKTLEFTPIFYDLDGIWHINAAVYQSDKPFSDLTKNELIKLRYKELKNKKRGSIDISRFTDGIIHLILKVTDQNQNGTATSFTDIPILIDRKPIGFSSIALRRDLTYSTGPTMNLIFSKSAGSALDYSSLKISSKTKTLTMVNPVYSPTIQSPALDTIQLNWPMLFRHDLRKIKNGEVFNITIKGIQDGAGNRTKEHIIPIKMDHAKDKDLPNWMAMKTPNTIMHMKWLGQITQQKYLIPAKGNTAVIINKPGKESFLRSKAPGIAGSIIYKGKWVTSVYPKFAMRYKLAKDAKSAFNLLLMVYKSYIHINLHPLDNKYAAFIKQYKSEDGWVNCFIDMDALLKDEQTRINIKKNKKGFIIKQIFFNRAKTVKNEAIDIQTMSMYRDLRTTDKLKLDGFDASGIACYDWEIIRDKKAVSSGSSTSLKVDFSKIPFANKKGHWLNIYLRDNSNTRSVPLRIAL